jgi:hypothetical protein
LGGERVQRRIWYSGWFWTLVILGGYYVWSTHEVRHGPGRVAPGRPAQAAVRGRPAIEHGAARLHPRAVFRIEARVLGKERYWIDSMADVSPIDLALGWGPMSDEHLLDQLDIDQAHRRVYTNAGGPLPISGQLMSLTHTNMHVIPADRAVRRALRRLRRGDVVRLEGLLVDVERGAAKWKTSLVRHDYGDGACEIMYVTQVEERRR